MTVANASAVNDLYSSVGVDLPTVRLLFQTEGGLPVWGCEIEAGAAPRWWQRTRDVHDRTGFWPFLLGLPQLDEELVEEMFSDSGGNGSAHYAEDGLRIDAVERLRGLADRENDNLRQVGAPAVTVDTVLRTLAEAGTAPSSSRLDLGGDMTLLGLVEAQQGYAVPGLLSWQGAVNYVLQPADHVAVLKHWCDRYGAELVVLAFDTMELWVHRPPTEPQTVAEVAVEQHAYCPDLLGDFQTVAGIGARQVRGRYWHFWWD